MAAEHRHEYNKRHHRGLNPVWERSSSCGNGHCCELCSLLASPSGPFPALFSRDASTDEEHHIRFLQPSAQQVPDLTNPPPTPP